MGNFLARRQNHGVDDYDANGGGGAYFYPPKVGNYFSTHFIMGGERFETSQPEAYLFGENMDLNFLGGKPMPFPYSAPLPHEPTRTLRALINIRKESLRLIKVPLDVNIKPSCDVNNTQAYQDLEKRVLPEELPKDRFKYNIEFIFDTDVQCGITIYYMCTEELVPSGLVYTPKDNSKTSETYVFKKGANQYFSQSLHVFDPSSFDEDDLMYRAFDEHGNFDTAVPFPVVIHCVAQEGEQPRQSHSLIAVVERNGDGSFSMKPFKQKLFIDGLCYLFQEIYGIENKSVTAKRSSDNSQLSPEDDADDNGSECVICMSDSRDTLILPCRHLCLCYACADSLRYQANNCPICRSPFRALLQLKAVRKSLELTRASSALPPNSTLLVPQNQRQHNQHHVLCESANDLIDIPPGYEAVSLIETLNGTVHVPQYNSRGMYHFRRVSDNRAVIATPLENRKFKVAKRTKALSGTEEPASPSSLDGGESIEREKWSTSPENHGPFVTSELSTESATSSNVSEAPTNTSLQEKIGLLVSEKDESDSELYRRVSLADERELTTFQHKASDVYGPKEKPLFNLASASVPVLCVAENSYLTETDLTSPTSPNGDEMLKKENVPNAATDQESEVKKSLVKKFSSSLPNVQKDGKIEELNLTPVYD